MATLANIRVEPVKVFWNDVDVGYTDGEISVDLTEDGVDITAHQEGTNVLDKIITGHKVEVALTLKETSAAQIATMLKAGGSAATGVAQVTSVTCIADSSGNLNNQYFKIAKGATGDFTHYVWYNINSAGVDPAPSGLTGIQVTEATDATAADIATATQTAVDASSDFAATVNGAVVTITNSAVGQAPDAIDGAATTGFTITTTTHGVGAVSGWGNAKDFQNVSTWTEALRLHPVVLDATDFSRDLTFWKAYPIPKSIKYSGENPLMVEISFALFPDFTRPDEIRLFAYGASL